MTSLARAFRHLLYVALALAGVSACGGGGGGGGSSSSGSSTYHIGGNVSGLAVGNTLVLMAESGDSLNVTANGAFQFPGDLPDGSSYLIAVQQVSGAQAQQCSILNGSGTISGADVSDIEVACFPSIQLTIVPSSPGFDVSWNTGDYPGAVYDLCYAEEPLSAGFGACGSHSGGTLLTDVSSPLSGIEPSTPDTSLWFSLRVSPGGGHSIESPDQLRIPAPPDTIGQNDTGIILFGTLTNSFLSAPQPDYPGQDANHGRDAAALAGTLTKRGDGPAGFDYLKLDAAGRVLPSSATAHECVMDNVTGLVWEVKATSGLRDAANTYTWRNTDSGSNGGDPGVADGGTCSGSDCDTAAYIAAVNASGLCGFTSGWRLPSVHELLSISDNSNIGPAVALDYFPNTPEFAFYWSSTANARRTIDAWYVGSLYGYSNAVFKGVPFHARAVRDWD